MRLPSIDPSPLAVFLGEGAALRRGQDVQHRFRRAASFTPSGVTTMGRLMRIGCAHASINSSSEVADLRVPIPIGRALLPQQLARGDAHARG